MNSSSFVNLKPEALSYLYNDSSQFEVKSFQVRSLDGHPLSKSQQIQQISEHRTGLFIRNYCNYFTETFPIDTSRVSPKNLKTKVDDFMRRHPEKASLDERFKNVLRFSGETEHVAFWIEAGITPSTPALNLALKNNSSIETTTLLLSHGAKPNEKSLSHACLGTNPVEKITLLLKYGATPNNDTLSSFIRGKFYHIASNEHSKEGIQIFALLCKTRFQIDEGLLNLAIANKHPPKVIQRLLKECMVSEVTIQLLLTNFYPFETIEFAMKQTETYDVTDVNEDVLDDPGVKVPLFDQETLMDFAKLSDKYSHSKDIMRLFVSDDKIAEITGDSSSSI